MEDQRTMRTAVRIAAAVLALGAAACSGPSGQQFTAKDQASIRAKNEALVQAINTKDVGKIVDQRPQARPHEPMVFGQEQPHTRHVSTPERLGSGLPLLETR